ncbi:phytanoyl-CoA dioxygenase, partial [Mycobacterium sp. ITM-2017-0098]
MATSLRTPGHTASAQWLDGPDFEVEAFRAQVERETDLADYPYAHE